MSASGPDPAPGPQTGESRRQIQQFADSLPQLIFELDGHRRLTFVNRACFESFGYTREDFERGLDALDMIVPADRERAAVRLRQVLAGETLSSEEYTALRKDGSSFPIVLSSSVLFEGGTAAGLRGIIVDISDRKRAEETTRQAEERQRVLLDHVDEIVYAVRTSAGDPLQGAVEFVSAQAERITGHPSAAFLSDSSLFLGLIEPQDAPAVAEATLRILASGQPGSREYRLRHRDGSLHWVEDRIVPRLDADGQLRGYFGVARDVTERKRVEEALRSHTRQQAAVAELAQMALGTGDVDTLLGEVTARVARTLSVELSKVLEYRPGSNDFLLRAGVGWRPGAVGVALVPGGPASQAGHTISVDAPVVVEDLSSESRFSGPPLLHDHGVVSGMSVVVKANGRPWGVLGAHTTQRRVFTADDVNFLLSVAHLVAGALERIQAEAATRHRVRMESLLASISTRFINLPAADLDAEIDHALRQVGESAGVDRSYLFQIARHGTRMSNTHEWCRDPAQAQIRRLQELPVQPFSWSMRQLQELKVVHVPRVRDLPPAASAERAEFEAEGIRSLVLVPLSFGGELRGIVGFDAVEREKSWSAEDIQILRMLAEIFTNALERRRAETAHRESMELFRRAFHDAPIGMALVGLDDRFLEVNRALCEILGRSTEELLQTTVAAVTHPEDRQAEASHKRELHERAQDSFRMSKRYLRKDGQVVWGQLSASLLSDPDGTPLYYIGQLEDITERKTLEEQLLASQKMEAVGRLAGGVAHDFNNLLNVIIGYGDLMKSRLPEGDPFRRHVTEILGAADRAAGLTRQLLAFGRKQILMPVVLDLGGLVEGLGSLLRRLIGEDIEFTLAVPPRLGRVRADPGQIEQVIINLVVNSRDAMPRGGCLRVGVEDVDVDEELARETRGLAPGPYVRLSVSDTGLGMDAETRRRIFEPFFTTKQKGTGLGLSTVYGIVKQSEGYVSVESEPGRGTTFGVYLPRVKAGAPEWSGPVRVAEPEPGWETVLLVEDEEMVRRVTRQLLESRGYQVLETGNAEEAIRIVQGHAGPIHLLLTDVVMPGTGGPALAERLTRSRPELRVLFMSGHADAAMPPLGVLAADVAFIQKPFTADSLARKVQGVLRGLPARRPASDPD